jgi:hypothetical protein
MDPDLRKRTPLDSPDIPLETTNQKVGAPSPSERAAYPQGRAEVLAARWSMQGSSHFGCIRMTGYSTAGRLSPSARCCGG